MHGVFESIWHQFNSLDCPQAMSFPASIDYYPVAGDSASSRWWVAQQRQLVLLFLDIGRLSDPRNFIFLGNRILLRLSAHREISIFYWLNGRTAHRSASRFVWNPTSQVSNPGYVWTFSCKGPAISSAHFSLLPGLLPLGPVCSRWKEIYMFFILRSDHYKGKFPADIYPSLLYHFQDYCQCCNRLRLASARCGVQEFLQNVVIVVDFLTASGGQKINEILPALTSEWNVSPEWKFQSNCKVKPKTIWDS